MADKTSAVMNYIDASGSKGSKTVTDVDPAADSFAIADFVTALNDLTTNTISSIEKVERTDITNAEPTTDLPDLIDVDAMNTAVSALTTAVFANKSFVEIPYNSEVQIAKAATISLFIRNPINVVNDGTTDPAAFATHLYGVGVASFPSGSQAKKLLFFFASDGITPDNNQYVYRMHLEAGTNYAAADYVLTIVKNSSVGVSSFVKA